MRVLIYTTCFLWIQSTCLAESFDSTFSQYPPACAHKINSLLKKTAYYEFKKDVKEGRAIASLSQSNVYELSHPPEKTPIIEQEYCKKLSEPYIKIHSTKKNDQLHVVRQGCHYKYYYIQSLGKDNNSRVPTGEFEYVLESSLEQCPVSLVKGYYWEKSKEKNAAPGRVETYVLDNERCKIQKTIKNVIRKLRRETYVNENILNSRLHKALEEYKPKDVDQVISAYLLKDLFEATLNKKRLPKSHFSNHVSVLCSRYRKDFRQTRMLAEESN